MFVFRNLLPGSLRFPHTLMQRFRPRLPSSRNPAFLWRDPASDRLRRRGQVVQRWERGQSVRASLATAVRSSLLFSVAFSYPAEGYKERETPWNRDVVWTRRGQQKDESNRTGQQSSPRHGYYYPRSFSDECTGFYPPKSVETGGEWGGHYRAGRVLSPRCERPGALRAVLWGSWACCSASLCVSFTLTARRAPGLLTKCFCLKDNESCRLCSGALKQVSGVSRLSFVAARRLRCRVCLCVCIYGTVCMCICQL